MFLPHTHKSALVVPYWLLCRCWCVTLIGLTLDFRGCVDCCLLFAALATTVLAREGLHVRAGAPSSSHMPLTRPQKAAKVVNKKQPAATNNPKATSPVAPGAPKDAARNLLQWGGWGGGGWSGSQSQAQAQAQSQGWGGGGFGGWGGSGSQGECCFRAISRDSSCQLSSVEDC